MTRESKTALNLFIFCLLFYLLLSGGHLYTVDEETQFRVTAAMCEEGSISIEQADDKNLNLAQGGDGLLYSYYAPATSVVGIPFYLTGKFLARLAGVGEFYATRMIYSFQGPVWGAVCAALIFKILVGLGATARDAAAVSIIHAFGTYACMEFRTIVTNFPVGVLFLAAFYFILLGKNDYRHGLFSGLALSGAFLYRYDTAILWPIWLIGGRRFAAGCLIGLIPGILAGGGYNYSRFGSVLATGSADTHNLFSGNLLEGLLGLTVMPNRGLLWYSPLSVAGLWGLLKIRERHRRSINQALVLLVVHLVFVSWLAIWNGGATWGPRHLGAFIPLLSLGIWPLWKLSRPWVRNTGVAAAVFLQIFSTTVSFDSWNDLLWDYGIPYEASWSTFEYNPWRGHFEVLKRVNFEQVPENFQKGATQMPVGSSSPNQIIRGTLDYWPVYAYKMNAPVSIWSIVPAMLLFGAALSFWNIRRETWALDGKQADNMET